MTLGSESDRLSAILRLGLLRGVDTALQRRQEVLAAIIAADSAEEARAAVQELLGLDEQQTSAVLNLRWEDLAGDQRRTISTELAQQDALVTSHAEHPDH